MDTTLGYFLILLLEWWYEVLVKLKNNLSKCQDQAVGALEETDIQADTHSKHWTL